MKGQLRCSAIVLFLLLFLLSGIAAGMGVSPQSPAIFIQGQEARLSPAMLGVGSIFMKIKNSGNGDDILLSARVDISGTITELHDVQEGKMVRREKIVIPAKSVVELKPRSLHIMVFKMPEDVKEEKEFILYLMFEKSGEKRIPVKFIRSSGGPEHPRR